MYTELTSCFKGDWYLLNDPPSKETHHLVSDFASVENVEGLQQFSKDLGGTVNFFQLSTSEPNPRDFKIFISYQKNTVE